MSKLEGKPKTDVQKSNDFIRQMARKGVTNISPSDGFTHDEMNQFIRGKSKEEILAARPKPKEPAMNTDQIVAALKLMQDGKMGWTEAKDSILKQAKEEEDKAKVSEFMNQAIRAKRGTTVIVPDEEEESKNG